MRTDTYEYVRDTYEYVRLRRHHIHTKLQQRLRLREFTLQGLVNLGHAIFLFEFYVKLNSRCSRIRAPNYATVRYDSTFNENINLEYRLQKIAQMVNIFFAIFLLKMSQYHVDDTIIQIAISCSLIDTKKKYCCFFVPNPVNEYPPAANLEATTNN